MALTLTAPVQWQTFQRDNSTGLGTINIAGTGTVEDADVQARFDGGAWVSIGTVSGGAFNGTLTGQPSGQGTLEVREGEGATEDSATKVGIGDIFVASGQSQISGRGTNNQVFTQSPGGVDATLFGNDYTWKIMADPTDSKTDQVDLVSRDNFPTMGSFIPIFASQFVEEYEYPCAFIPCSRGGTSITVWKDFGVDRETLYGSQTWRTTTASDTNGTFLVIWMQGQSDTVPADPMGMKTYQDHFEEMANDIASRYGCKTIPSLMVRTPVRDEIDMKKIDDATLAAQRNNINIIPGPDFSFLTDDDGGGHVTTDGKIAQVANAFFRFVKTYKSSLATGTTRARIT